VSRILELAGVIFLTNRSHRLPPPYHRTLLVGLDDHMSGHPDPTGPEWDEASFTILLMHQPSGLLDAANRPFDIALAGHTHGGQILLPGGFAPVVPQGSLSRRYLAGRFGLDRARHLLVSVGLGNSGLPIRLGPTPEIVVCDLIGPGKAT
jgi:predicted MPP superfamily phosphohydrolase